MRKNTRNKRIPVFSEASIFCGNDFQPAVLGNISREGLYVSPLFPARREDFENASRVDIRLHAPPGKDIELRCRQRWVSTSSTGARLKGIGLEIIDPPPEYETFYRSKYFDIRNEISRNAIAVIGMSCFYPGAPALQHLWENVLSRRREFRRIPDQRLPLSDYYDPDPSTPDKTYASKAAVLDGFEFDWLKHGIPRPVVESSDIAHWLALETSLRALEDAGFSRGTVPTDRSGVILGNTLTGENTRSENMRLRWPFVRKALIAAAAAKGLSSSVIDELSSNMEGYYKSVFAPVTEDTLAGGLSNTIAGRICNYFDFNGGGYTVDGACSSSLIAVATAATALSCGNLDLAVAGGVDISLDTFELIGFAKTNALTRDDMRVYDRRASGFIPGEGAGFVVLKRLEDARSDGDYVYAVLRGWGISSDGKGGITAPKAEAQALAIRKAYTQTGYSIRDVDFIEGHGTGTPAGDKAELEGIAMAMDDTDGKPLRSCGITSLKSIIGHTKAASGIGGFIKAVMSVNRRILPPTAGCKDPNDVFDKTAISAYPIIRGEIRSPEDTIRAGVSGMGFGGINCHVTVESGDLPSERLTPSIGERELLSSAQDTELFILSASSPEVLLDRINGLTKIAGNISMGELVDLSGHMSGAIQNDHPVRASLIASTPEELVSRCDRLAALITGTPVSAGEIRSGDDHGLWLGHSVNRTNVGFLFPGQGSQLLSAARTLVERHSWARELCAHADEILGREGMEEISGEMFRPLERALDQQHIDGWKKSLSRSEIAQPAICLASTIWMRYLDSIGIRPVAVGGHSLGELTAFHAAGAFDHRSLLRLASIRGRAMAAPDAEAGAMAVFGCDRHTVEKILESVAGYAVVANINGPKQTVLSGDRTAVENAVETATAQGMPAKLLPVSNAFHSKYVSKASEIIRNVTVIPERLSATDIGLFSCMEGGIIQPGMDLRNHFADQIISKVDFISLVRAMRERCDLLVEVGPGQVLTGLVKSIPDNENMVCFPVEPTAGNDRALNVFLGAYFAHGGNVNWPSIFENRLVRPFVSPEHRVFISNPCERPFKEPLSDQSRSSSGSGGLVGSMVAQVTDLPPAALAEYMNRRGPFLSAVIKADLEHSSTREDYEMPASSGPEIIDVSGDQTPGESAKLVPGDNGEDRTSIDGLLLDIVEKRTGFPRESLSMEHRLLDDLNLDSIKASELIAAAALRLGVAGDMDTARFANATLSEISENLSRLSGINRHADGPTEGREISLTTAHRTWVRNFVVDYVPRGLESVNTESETGNEWSRAHVLIMCEESEAGHAVALKDDLIGRNARAEILHFSRTDIDAVKKSAGLTHLVTVLPTMANDGLPSYERLEKTIERLRTALTLSSRLDHGKRPTLAYVQFGANCGGMQMESGDVEHCAIAFAASLHHERPDLKIRVIDFMPGADRVSTSRCILDELAANHSFSVAAYDAELVRHVPLSRVHEPAGYGPRSFEWTADDVVLVTGGAKGITAECSLAFARATGVKMVLVGTSPHPDEAQEDTGPSEISRTLERFSSEGLSCSYYRCDITDAESVGHLIRKIRLECGDITGVIHGAGLNKPRRVDTVSREEALAEVGPKVLGAMNICGALQGSALNLFAVFSSIIGVTGMPGNAWYGFSNEALDRIVRRFGMEHRGTAVLSIAFSIWDEVGMGARMGSVEFLAKMGIGAIPPDEGVRRFLSLALNDPGARQVVVTARLGGLDTWERDQAIESPTARYLEHVLACEPGIEVIARADLSLEKDAYVQDHLWNGTYLFPTVFGLEAMAQAVAYITSMDNFDTVVIEDVSLERPITVLPDSGCTIEIRAEVIERERERPEQRVRVGIGCDQSGFSTDHFSATFVFGDETEPKPEPIDIPERALDIRPEHDLYGGLLFQGPLFQRISRIYSLDSKKCVFRSELHPPTSEKPENRGNAARWVLGDPFFRDSLLHAPQLPLSPDICLPVRIGRIARYRTGGDALASPLGAALIEKRVDDEYHATVSIGRENGEIMERLDGYVLKILKRNDEFPTPEELAGPGQRDENIARTEFTERARRLGVSLPEISVAHDPAIQGLGKKERRTRELPLLTETVRRALNGKADVQKDIRIKWLESGRPAVEGVGNNEINISLSHDGGTVLCVAGPGAQGCDIEKITHRSHEEWTALIGGRRENLLRELIIGGHPMDKAGTMIWTAAEALFKATGSQDASVEILKHDGDSALFHADSSGMSMLILTVPVVLTRSPARVISIIVHEKGGAGIPALNTQKDRHAGQLNFNSEAYKADIEDGPHGNPVFIFQFPVTFKEASNASRTLYFSHYFAWIGKLREFVIFPIYEKLVESFSAGKWGMVTNHAETAIFGSARSGDIIEGRVSVDKISGKEQSTIEVRYEWWKRLPGGNRVQVAFSTMSTTWVAILGHGTVEVRPLPEYCTDFFGKLLPQSGSEDLSHAQSEAMQSLDMGNELYCEPAGPVRSSALLNELVFETSLEDANLVGNIYFSNYYVWQGRTRDHYVKELLRDHHASGRKGEFRCSRCRVDHMNEAMPFDRVVVRMYLSAVHDRGIRFFFDYYRLTSDGKRHKLGFGEHHAVWFEPNELGQWMPSSLPDAIRIPIMPQSRG